MAEYDVPAMVKDFERWWDAHGEKWRRLEANRRRDYLDTFAAGYAAATRGPSGLTEGEMIARGMEVVNRVIEATGPCAKNPHGERHCYHWRGQPPTLRTRVQADCCWCGVTRAFDYMDVIEGNAPRMVTPTGGIHGEAREWLGQPTTYALGRLSAKGAARDHARKMADAALGGEVEVPSGTGAENPTQAPAQGNAHIQGSAPTATRGPARGERRG